MNCRQFQKRLPMLLDKNPDSEVSAELRSHIQECPDCAREYDEARAAISALLPSPSISASRRLRERTMERIRQLDAAGTSSRPANATVQRLRPRWRGYSTYAVAAAVILLTIGVFSWKTGQGSAFAQVVEQIAKARTFTYMLTPHMQGMPDMRIKTLYMSPGLIRSEFPGGTYSVADVRQHKGISVMPERKQYIELTLPENGQTSDPARFDTIGWLQRLAADSGVLIGEKVVGGRQLRGYRATGGGANWLIYADPAGRIVEVEFELINMPGVKCTMSDIRYDEPLDEALFSMIPPQGYTPMEDAGYGKPLEEADLIEMLRTWATRSVDGTFPPTLNVAEFSKVMPTAFKKEMPAGGKPLSREQVTQEATRMARIFSRSAIFVTMMTPANDWHYAGAGIKMGDATKAIAWWKPTNSNVYRVIYGDLSAKDVPPDQVPGAASTQ